MKHLLIILSILHTSSPLFGQETGDLYLWGNGTKYMGEWKIESKITPLKPTPSSPVSNPTNSSQSDTLQVKPTILVKYSKSWYKLGSHNPPNRKPNETYTHYSLPVS